MQIKACRAITKNYQIADFFRNSSICEWVIFKYFDYESKLKFGYLDVNTYFVVKQPPIKKTLKGATKWLLWPKQKCYYEIIEVDDLF